MMGDFDGTRPQNRYREYQCCRNLVAAVLETAIADYRCAGTMTVKRCAQIAGAARGRVGRGRQFHSVQNMHRKKSKPRLRVSLCMFAHSLGFETPRDELLNFFDGDWFEYLCDALDLDSALARKRVLYGERW